MPTVFERINLSVDTGDLDDRLGVQVQQLGQIVRLVSGLIDDPPDDLGGFLDLTSNLPVPEFEIGGDFAAALGGALDTLPADLGDVTGAARGALAEFVELVTGELQPLLQDAVRIAAAVDRLVSMDFRCSAGAAASGGGGAGAGGAPSAESNQGAARMTRAAEQVRQVNDLLDRLPPSRTPGGLLEFIFQMADQKARNKFFQLAIPVLDDIVEPLRTLSRWGALTPEAIGQELEATIVLLDQRLRAAVPQILDGIGADLAALQAQLQLPALTSFTGDYARALDELIATLQVGDPAGTVGPVAALHDALDEAAPALAAWEGAVATDLAALCVRLRALSDELLDRLSHLLTLLEPVELPSLAVGVAKAPQPPDAAAIAAVQQAVQPVLDWLNDLVGLLDFSAVQSRVTAVASEAQTLADGIQQGLTGVTLQVQALFDGLSGQLSGLDLNPLQDELNAQIRQFGVTLQQELRKAFDPAADAIGAAVQGLSNALDDFDPADVVAALQSVVQAITDVLQSGDVQAAIEQVQSVISSLTATLQQLSFAPVTDQVVALIEQMTRALQQLQGTDMNDAAKAALAVALQVLPDDLKPVTDPLRTEFDQLIETGPVPLLARVAEKPAQLLGAINRFQPGALVGATLGGPYRAVISKADGFQPSSLLQQADGALQGAKHALVQSAAPGRALAALSGPFNEIRDMLNGYSPEAILGPLEQAVEGAVQQVIDASPVDEIFAQVNRVFDQIDTALDVPRSLVATLERLDVLLQGFADSGRQLDEWRDTLLDKVLEAGNFGDIGNALSNLADTVSTTTHTALLSRYDSAVQSLTLALDAFAPGDRVTTLVTAYHRARALTNRLADSPEKSAVSAVLSRLDPGQTPSLRLIQQLRQSLSQARDDVVAIAEEWQVLVEDPQGLLAEISAVSADADGLRQLLAMAAEPVLAPLRYLFALLEAGQPAVAATLDTLQQLVEDLTGGVANLLTGPGSLQDISNAVQQVVDTLRNIDLGFLREGLQRLFLDLQDQLAAVDPGQLGPTLDGTFGEVLDGIRLSTVISPATVTQLDADYAAMLDKLRDLDPESLITEVVQPEFDATVGPLVRAFDLTPVFNALIELLRRLGDELGGELERVNGAYQSLRAARPSLAGVINVNISF